MTSSSSSCLTKTVTEDLQRSNHCPGSSGPTHSLTDVDIYLHETYSNENPPWIRMHWNNSRSGSRQISGEEAFSGGIRNPGWGLSFRWTIVILRTKITYLLAMKSQGAYLSGQLLHYSTREDHTWLVAWHLDTNTDCGILEEMDTVMDIENVTMFI